MQKPKSKQEQKLELELEAELREACQKIFLITGKHSTRFIANIEKSGAVAASKMILSGNKTSDTFDLLAEKGKLADSIEAVLIKSRYGVLFDDEEVDNALSRLVDEGYYG